MKENPCGELECENHIGSFECKCNIGYNVALDPKFKIPICQGSQNSTKYIQYVIYDISEDF